MIPSAGGGLPRSREASQLHDHRRGLTRSLRLHKGHPLHEPPAQRLAIGLRNRPGDEVLVTNMLVGDLQRIIEYPKLGFAIEQEVPKDVHAAYQRLLTEGFTRRLLTT